MSLGCGPGRQIASPERPVSSRASARTAGPGGNADALPLDHATAAENAWAQRDRPEELRRAIRHWEALLQTEPDRENTLTRLARAHYFLADGHLSSGSGRDQAQLDAFEKGVWAGERAMMAASSEFAERVKRGDKVEEAVLSIPPSGLKALYWYAANLGKFAVTKGFTTTLFYKNRIFAVMQRVLTLDETFFHGAPHRYFGAFHAKAPSFAGGDIHRSKIHFDRALALGPDYLGTKVLYAEFYATKTDDRALFARLLNEVLAADPGKLPNLEPEQRLEQLKAKRLLTRIDELF